MRSDSVKNMSAYADQNHAPSLTDVRLELSREDSHLKNSDYCLWMIEYPVSITTGAEKKIEAFSSADTSSKQVYPFQPAP